jgi:hypothetical protein
MSDFYGQVAKCEDGRFGIITTVETISKQLVFFGVGFGGRPWSSKSPKFISRSLNEYFKKDL